MISYQAPNIHHMVKHFFSAHLITELTTTFVYFALQNVCENKLIIAHQLDI